PRPWGAPECRRATRCAPRCGRVERNAVPAADRKATRTDDESLTGALPTPPMPKAALVTGGARRIGRALSLALAEAGFAVAIHYHCSQEEAQALAGEIGRSGGKAVALAADLAEEAAVAELLPRAIAAVGPIGVLVNN